MPTPTLVITGNAGLVFMMDSISASTYVAISSTTIYTRILLHQGNMSIQEYW